MVQIHELPSLQSLAQVSCCAGLPICLTDKMFAVCFFYLFLKEIFISLIIYNIYLKLMRDTSKSQELICYYSYSRINKYPPLGFSEDPLGMLRFKIIFDFGHQTTFKFEIYVIVLAVCQRQGIFFNKNTMFFIQQ